MNGSVHVRADDAGGAVRADALHVSDPRWSEGVNYWSLMYELWFSVLFTMGTSGIRGSI